MRIDDDDVLCMVLVVACFGLTNENIIKALVFSRQENDDHQFKYGGSR